MFGLTTEALRSRRVRGQIEGIVISENNVLYTEEQIKRADLSQRKRGPKPKKNKTNEQEKDVA